LYHGSLQPGSIGFACLESAAVLNGSLRPNEHAAEDEKESTSTDPTGLGENSSVNRN